MVGTAVGVALALGGGGEGKPAPTSPVASPQPPVITEKEAVAAVDGKLQSALPGPGPVQPSVFPRFLQDLDTLGQATGKVPQVLAARADGYALQSRARALEAPARTRTTTATRPPKPKRFTVGIETPFAIATVFAAAFSAARKRVL